MGKTVPSSIGLPHIWWTKTCSPHICRYFPYISIGSRSPQKIMCPTSQVMRCLGCVSSTSCTSKAYGAFGHRERRLVMARVYELLMEYVHIPSGHTTETWVKHGLYNVTVYKWFLPDRGDGR